MKQKLQPLIQRKAIQSTFDKSESINNNFTGLNSQSIIEKYNLFILCYNKSCNRIDEKTLSTIPHSKIFSSFNIFIKYTLAKILFLLSFLVPFINTILLIYLVIVIRKYEKGLKVYRSNQKKVLNPMKNMKYDPQKCYQLKKNFYFITINFKRLSSEYNIKENAQLTSSEGKSGLKSEWMIYNSQFASYYDDFPKWRFKLGVILLTALVQTVSSILLFLLLV